MNFPAGVKRDAVRMSLENFISVAPPGYQEGLNFVSTQKFGDGRNRQGAGHQIWVGANGARFSIPRHPGDLGTGLISKILKQAGISASVRDFMSAQGRDSFRLWDGLGVRCERSQAFGFEVPSTRPCSRIITVSSCSLSRSRCAHGNREQSETKVDQPRVREGIRSTAATGLQQAMGQ